MCTRPPFRLAVIAGLLGALCPAGAVADARVIAAGPAGSPDEHFAQRIAALAPDQARSLAVRVEAAASDAEALGRLGRGEAHLAIARCDLVHAAYEGRAGFATPDRSLRLIGVLQAEH